MHFQTYIVKLINIFEKQRLSFTKNFLTLREKVGKRSLQLLCHLADNDYPAVLLCLRTVWMLLRCQARYWCQKFDETELTYHEGSRIDYFSCDLFSFARDE